MMNRMAISFFLLVSVFFLITACASTLAKHKSLPPPSDDVKTILVIPTVTEKKYPDAAFGKYKLTLADDHGTIKLDYGLDYIIVSGLEPGTYKIEKINFVYNVARARVWEQKVSIPFVLKPGYITVLNRRFKFVLYRRGEPYRWLREQFI